jgi:hypothetical protein
MDSKGSRHHLSESFHVVVEKNHENLIEDTSCPYGYSVKALKTLLLYVTRIFDFLSLIA